MLLRQSEVEQKYRLSKTTLHRWLKEGKLTEHRTVGGHRRYDSAEIEALFSVSDGVSVSDKDLVEDILTIIVSFSSRIYGKRGGRKRKEMTDADNESA